MDYAIGDVQSFSVTSALLGHAKASRGHAKASRGHAKASRSHEHLSDAVATTSDVLASPRRSVGVTEKLWRHREASASRRSFDEQQTKNDPSSEQI